MLTLVALCGAAPWALGVTDSVLVIKAADVPWNEYVARTVEDGVVYRNDSSDGLFLATVGAGSAADLISGPPFIDSVKASFATCTVDAAAANNVNEVRPRGPKVARRAAFSMAAFSDDMDDMET